MPRFYDSEEDGAGSLVFVGDAGSIVTRTHQSSASGLSPKLGPSSSNHNGNLFIRSSNSSEDDGGGSVVKVPSSTKEALPRSNNSNGEQPQLLPYQHRKKLSRNDLKDLQQPFMLQAIPPMSTTTTTATPPTNPVDESAAASAAAAAAQLTMSPTNMGDASRRPFPTKAPPPPMPPVHLNVGTSPPSLLASSKFKYKVATIPAFNGGASSKLGASSSGRGGGQNHERQRILVIPTTITIPTIAKCRRPK